MKSSIKKSKKSENTRKPKSKKIRSSKSKSGRSKNKIAVTEKTYYVLEIGTNQMLTVYNITKTGYKMTVTITRRQKNVIKIRG